jgi:uncharacterized protein (DUF2141 family)
MIRTIHFLSILLLLVLPLARMEAQTVEVTVTGIRSDRGHISIGVFRDSESYMKEETYVDKVFDKNTSRDGEMTVRFDLEPGIYGLCLLDDENSDGKMAYNFLRMPKEGFGFSDLYHTGFTKPKFDSFKFKIDKGQTRRITIRVRYIL